MPRTPSGHFSNQLNKMDKMVDHALKANRQLRSARKSRTHKNPDLEIDEIIQENFEHSEEAILPGGKKVTQRLNEIRREADDLAVRLMKQNFNHSGMHSERERALEKECKGIVREYIELIATDQGQDYRQCLYDRDNAHLEVVRKKVQIEYTREQIEKKHPELNVRELYGGMIPADFWDFLGHNCQLLFRPEHLQGKHFVEIYDHLLQLKEKEIGNLGLYIGIIRAYKTLNAYDHDPVTLQPSRTVHDFEHAVYALTHAGNTLVRQCFIIEGIIARQPRVTDQNGFSRPLYANVAEYFQNVQFHERGLPARQKNAITECIRRFGTLFGLPYAVNVVFTVGQRQPGDSKAVLRGSPSSS